MDDAARWRGSEVYHDLSQIERRLSHGPIDISVYMYIYPLNEASDPAKNE